MFVTFWNSWQPLSHNGDGTMRLPAYPGALQWLCCQEPEDSCRWRYGVCPWFSHLVQISFRFCSSSKFTQLQMPYTDWLSASTFRKEAGEPFFPPTSQNLEARSVCDLLSSGWYLLWEIMPMSQSSHGLILKKKKFPIFL